MQYHPLHHKKIDHHDNHRLLIGDILGWIGAASIIGAYLLVSSGVVVAQSYPYQIMNIIGGSGLLVLGITRRAYPSVTTNIMWVVIGVFAVIGLAFGL
jgi:hypothetical protein